ncbi:rab effector Noc2 isoform X13 [Macaca fascicularis]|uniref:rab effector Noc2 isoform X13 n=1 Tax=Macaca fascicularis TaxID=9541 RepID=UPI003D15AF30
MVKLGSATLSIDRFCFRSYLPPAGTMAQGCLEDGGRWHSGPSTVPGIRAQPALTFLLVSSDSDSDSDLSSSSLEDRLPPAGVRGPKGNKPRRESGGSVEAPRMGFTHPPGHLSGSQSSLASEMGTGSADPQGGTLPQADPKGPGKRHTWTSPQC